MTADSLPYKLQTRPLMGPKGVHDTKIDSPTDR
jgi:hypothetical protein